MAVMLGSAQRESIVVYVEVEEYLDAKAVAAAAVRE